MTSITMGLISFGCISAGMLFGFFLNRTLPQTHLSSDSKDAVKMAWGIVATMSALILGLLVSSAKTSFDTVNAESAQAGAKLIILDRLLVRYGPDTQIIRHELRQAIATRIQEIWPEENQAIQGSAALETGKGMEAIMDHLDQLSPQTEVQRTSLAQARQIMGDLALERWLVVEQTQTALPHVYFKILVFWLTLLFIGIGLFAPANKTVVVSLLLCIISLSTAIFLAEEMSRPLDGIIKVSSAPMRAALAHLGQP